MRKLYISVGKRQYLHANCTAFAILFGLNYLYKAKPVVRWPRIILKHYFGAHSVLIRYVFGSLFLQCVQKGPQLPTWSACGPNCWNGLHFHHTRHPPHNWGIYVCWFCVLVLDIFCQQLGNICQLNLYIVIGYILPTIGDISQLESVCAPFGRRVGGICIVFCIKHTFVVDIYCQQFENIYQFNIRIGIGYILPTIGEYMPV